MTLRDNVGGAVPASLKGRKHRFADRFRTGAVGQERTSAQSE
jgi:hypothetical protein